MEDQPILSPMRQGCGNGEHREVNRDELVRPDASSAIGKDPQREGDVPPHEAQAMAGDSLLDAERQPLMSAHARDDSACLDGGSAAEDAVDSERRESGPAHLPYTVFGAIPESDGGPGPDPTSAADSPSLREKKDCAGNSEPDAAPSRPSCGEGQPDSRNSGSSGHNKDLGRRGEQAAARFLERRGMEVLERNWVCSAGEADIIAHDGEAIHFVEVKTRSNIAHGFPSEAVTPEKRSRYERIAAIYLSRNEYVDVNVLFDIISIVVTGPNRAFLRFHRNAFASCD